MDRCIDLAGGFLVDRPRSPSLGGVVGWLYACCIMHWNISEIQYASPLRYTTSTTLFGLRQLRGHNRHMPSP